MKNSRWLSSVLLLGAVVAVPAVAPGDAAGAAAAKRAPARTAPAPAVVPFIDNDLDHALAEAKRRDLPVFVESWAPW